MSSAKYDWEKSVEVRYQGTNVLIRLISLVIAVVEFCVGIRRVGRLAASGDGFRLTIAMYILWIFKRDEEVTFISGSKINAFSVGYTRRLLFFKRTQTTIYVSGMSPTTIVYKDAATEEVTDKFSELVM